ncbi:hypothetical protein SAMN05216223_105371 [Actinacidiphila yanglinensis]|uniref:Uncharacterized protein n=2 Tax=Actinacidiphila yanglinensis TaxID=310779 RepID=A0A1H6AH46_9ACTN|nr:hypothetical protein SAMN05216223_105371 [Actinacidiphila yanglinensis]
MAAPAFAADSTGSPISADDMSRMPTSINGGVDQALSEQPVQKAVDDTAVGSTLQKGQDAAHAAGSALSGAPGATGANGPAAAQPGSSPLGGLPLNGLPLGGLLGGLPLSGLPLG